MAIYAQGAVDQAQGAVDRICAMFAALLTTRLRHTTAWVLAAWLCVLLAGVGAPVVRAQASHAHAVHVCSGEWAPLDAPNPMQAAPADMALHHVLDCPLCLPMLAPPSQNVVAQLGVLPQAYQAAAGAQAAHVQRTHLPPVRAPPWKTWTIA